MIYDDSLYALCIIEYMLCVNIVEILKYQVSNIANNETNRIEIRIYFLKNNIWDIKFINLRLLFVTNLFASII